MLINRGTFFSYLFQLYVIHFVHQHIQMLCYMKLPAQTKKKKLMVSEKKIA